jgi:hypothetical protein
VLTPAEGGDEQRAERDNSDRDHDRESAPAGILQLAATSQRHGTP